MSRDGFRALSQDELRTILLASAAAGGYTYLAVMLMILTGQRIGQILRLEWSELDLKYAYWHRSPRQLGNHVRKSPPLPLATLTIRLFEVASQLPPLDGDRVLCRPGDEDRVLKYLRVQVNRQILLSTGSSLNWNTQALRRSFAEGCYRAGGSERQLQLALDLAPRWTGEKIFSKPADILKLFRPLAECWAMEIEDLLEPEGVNFGSLLPPKPILKVVK